MMNLVKEELRRSKDHRRIRRQRRMRRVMARFITVLSVLLLLVTFSGAIKSFAGQDMRSSTGSECRKCYTSIMIYPGDSIGSITDKYYSEQFKDKDSLAHEILSINHLSPERSLEPGNHIIVPVYLSVDD